MIASSLFHFTSFDSLKTIFVSGYLRASFNFERVDDLGKDFRYCAIPMVCFCDIPLRFVSKDHVAQYGSYGLAFKKQWAIKNGIQPLTYRIEGSGISKTTVELIESVKSSGMTLDKLYKEELEISGSQSVLKLISTTSKINGLIFDSYAFSKPYGRDGEFYREREWRYKAEYPLEFFQEYYESDKNEINEVYHQDMEDMSKYLNFKIADIEHIIIEKREDLAELVSHIDSTLSQMSSLDRYRLIQKVSDLETIQRDV